jgi:hypothetical protein
MTGSLAHTRVEENVGTIEIVKPKTNTYDLEMMRELDGAIEEMRFNEEPRRRYIEEVTPLVRAMGLELPSADFDRRIH